MEKDGVEKEGMEKDGVDKMDGVETVSVVHVIDAAPLIIINERIAM